MKIKSVKDLENLLNEIDIPWSKGRLEEQEDTEFPFMTYQIPTQNVFWADGVRYFFSAKIEICLYMDAPDGEWDVLVDEVLDKNLVPFEKQMNYINKPIDCYEVIYELEV